MLVGMLAESSGEAIRRDVGWGLWPFPIYRLRQRRLLLSLAQDLPHPSFLEGSLLEDARHDFLHEGLDRFGEA